MILIIGLGNPGEKYKSTRHNIGFRVIDEFSKRNNFPEFKISKKFKSLISEKIISDNKIMIAKPQTFMNRSGQAVATARGFYKIEFADVIVVSDDMALEPGVIRLRSKGSAGGHNGLKDIIAKLGTDQFTRLRVGIGQSPFPDYTGYVLGKPSQDEKFLLDQAKLKAVSCIEALISDGLDKAMTNFNN